MYYVNAFMGTINLTPLVLGSIGNLNPTINEGLKYSLELA
jgi:hypothetical protein